MLSSGARHPQDRGQITGNEIRSHPPGGLRLDHEPLERAEQTRTQLVGDRTGIARSEHLREPAVLDLRGDHRQQQFAESIPGIGRLQRPVDRRLQLVQSLCERGIDQRLLARKMPIQRSDSNPRAVRDQVNRGA